MKKMFLVLVAMFFISFFINPSPVIAGSEYLKKGNDAFMMTNWEKAADYYKIVLEGDESKGIEGDPWNIKARENLIECLIKMGRMSQVSEQVRILFVSQIIKEESITSKLHYINSSDFSGVEKELDERVARDPTKKKPYAKDLVHHGNILYAGGKKDIAWRVFSLAIKYDPSVRSSITTFFINQVNSQIARQDFSLAFTTAKEGIMFGGDNNEFENAILQILKVNKGNKNFDSYREKAVSLIGENTVKKDFPPKSWQVVHTEEHIGKGWDKDDSSEYHVKINYPGAYQQRQNIKCTGKFKFWAGDVLGWVEHNKEHMFFVDNPNVNGHPYVEIEKDEKLKFTIEEFK